MQQFITTSYSVQLYQVSFRYQGLYTASTIVEATFNPNNPKRRKTMTPEAEKFNGWMAMIGVVAALGAYATTGQIIPGIF